MPTYEYECKNCGHSFEVFQAMSDEPIKECSQCGSSVRRLIFGGSGVIFKGSGFYATDKGKRTEPGRPAAKSASKEACASCPAVSSGEKCPAAEVKTT